MTSETSAEEKAVFDPRTHDIIGAAMEVHSHLGPGHLEAVYQEALGIELGLRKIEFESQPRVTIQYKDRILKRHYLPDFIVRGEIVVEIKAQSILTSADEAQIVNSLKSSGRRVGLLINFGQASLKWKRYVC
jgi:GxxExxY protein